MDYTKDQLMKIRENFGLISINAITVLNTIKEENGINHTDIHHKADLSKFVTDKIIAAFLGAGLVKRVDDGTKRFYTITEDGKKLLELDEEEKKNGEYQVTRS